MGRLLLIRRSLVAVALDVEVLGFVEVLAVLYPPTPDPDLIPHPRLQRHRSVPTLQCFQLLEILKAWVTVLVARLRLRRHGSPLGPRTRRSTFYHHRINMETLRRILPLILPPGTLYVFPAGTDQQLQRRFQLREIIYPHLVSHPLKGLRSLNPLETNPLLYRQSMRLLLPRDFKRFFSQNINLKSGGLRPQFHTLSLRLFTEALIYLLRLSTRTPARYLPL